VDHLGLVKAIDRLGQSDVVAVADTAHRWLELPPAGHHDFHCPVRPALPAAFGGLHETLGHIGLGDLVDASAPEGLVEMEPAILLWAMSVDGFHLGAMRCQLRSRKALKVGVERAVFRSAGFSSHCARRRMRRAGSQPGFTPSPEPAIDGVPAAISVRHVTPWGTTPKPPQDAVYD
jgi:hypothetical protein